MINWHVSPPQLTDAAEMLLTREKEKVMSTRSCIARKTGDNTFLGVYHHWDGYPTALGATLLDLYNNHFQRDLSAMLRFLIDEHPAGWSSINGADFDLPAGFKADDDNRRCANCGLEQWKHYSQYYKAHKAQKFIAGIADGLVLVLGHAFVEQPATAKGPECYCHGSRKKEAQPITQADDAGMEWAYVFDEPNRILYVFERLYNPNAGEGTELFSGKKVDDLSFEHMTGMFGCGAPGKQHWAIAAKVELDGREPNWDDVSAAHYITASV